jgi:transposase
VAVLDPHDLVFVDETSSNIAMTRRYARSPLGERIGDKVPRNYGTSTTLVAALSLSGLGEAMTLPGAMNTAAFTVYVRQLLGPSLRPGQVVMMDNLSCHHAEEVRELIEARGCTLCHLPSYSPDFSPIEPAYSKIKEALRAAGARTQPALDEAITQALEVITAEDAVGWFSHCGYLVCSN